MRVHFFSLVLLGVVIVRTPKVKAELITDIARAHEFLEAENIQSQKMYNISSHAAWNYYTNLTDENLDIMMAAYLADAEYFKEVAENASMFDWKNFQNETIRWWFEYLTDLGTAAMPNKTKYERLNALVFEMEDIYSTGQVCMTDNECLDLEPGLTRLMATSRDYMELTKAWQGWRDQTGKKIKGHYEEFVSLSNEAIRANGYNDTGEYWLTAYSSETFTEDIEKLFLQLEPLYIQLHAYTRRKLMEVYGEDMFPRGGHIPAHLLGNMWAQSWTNLLDILQPYKDKESVDVTPQMKAQNYTALRMFHLSEEFFTSLGLLPMPQEFWDHSMIEKPTDGRDVVCHASAWDFYNGVDFRIQQCTDITMQDLITVHHEMGHIQYFLQYKHLPVAFRDGANPGFHEAIGDVMSLSVSTPKHLQEIGLLFNVEDDPESDINFMLSQALENIAFLPFGYLVDQWRWSVFSGETNRSNYNTKWWDLRCRYQGVSPPVPRSEDDFDPGAKYHIPGNVPYIRYFVSFILQFQFHKALCVAANQTGPLHKCDIYQSKEAGDLLRRVLELGSSRPWPEALHVITGQDKMDAGPIMEYFQPLIDWLEKENKGHMIGWEYECPDVIPLPTTPAVPTTPRPVTCSARSACIPYAVIILTLLLSVIKLIG